MTEENGLEQRLRNADPVDPNALPTQAETESALGRVSALRGRRRRLSLSGGSRPRWILGTTGALAVAGVLLVFLFSAAATPSPSFAVTRHHDGTVTVRLFSPNAIAGVNRRLRVMRIPARIALASARAAALGGCSAAAPVSSLRTFTFNPRAIPRGRMLLLAADPRLRFLYARAVGFRARANARNFTVRRLLLKGRGARGAAMLPTQILKQFRLTHQRFTRIGRLLALHGVRGNVAIRLLNLQMLRLHPFTTRLTVRPALLRAEAVRLNGPRTFRLYCPAKVRR